MPTGLLVRSQYTTNPTAQLTADDELEVRGFYTKNFIAGDGVTVIQGNFSNGAQGPYYSIGASLNGDGDLVVAAKEIQATTLSNPTANYIEQLWVNGAFVATLLPNTQSISGWAIPTVYGDPIAFDEIATYNRAKRLLYAPDSYFTADQTIQEILRLAGDFDYAAVGVNGITSMSVAPVSASNPIAVGDNDRRVPRIFNVRSYGAVGDGVTDDILALEAARDAAIAANGTFYAPYTAAGYGVTRTFLLDFVNSVADSLTVQGDSSSHGTNACSNLVWIGANSADPVLDILGAWNLSVNNFGVNCNSKALIGVQLRGDTGVGKPSAHIVFRNLVVSSPRGAAGSCAVQLGTNAFQMDDVSFYDPYFTGGTGVVAGIKLSPTAGNAKNFQVFGGQITGFDYALDGNNVPPASTMLLAGTTLLASRIADVRWGAGALHALGIRGEGSKMLLTGTTGGNGGTVTFESSYWTNVGAASFAADDVCISYTGSLVLKNNPVLYNSRTAGSLFKVANGGGAGASGQGVLISEGNNYYHSTGNAPLYDTSGNSLFDNSIYGTPAILPSNLLFRSFGDRGFDTTIDQFTVLENRTFGNQVLAGNVAVNGIVIRNQPTPSTPTTVTTLTIANLLKGILTATPSATGSTVAYTLPTGTLMSGGATFANDDSFDWSITNLAAAAADTITITAGVDHTIVGNPIVQSSHVTTGGITGNSAVFRSRKISATVWVTYRYS